MAGGNGMRASSGSTLRASAALAPRNRRTRQFTAVDFAPVSGDRGCRASQDCRRNSPPSGPNFVDVKDDTVAVAGYRAEVCGDLRGAPGSIESLHCGTLHLAHRWAQQELLPQRVAVQ